jgi:cobalt-precorrin 5A hydrolase/precorrin-3B C17-methyltransferase
MARLTPPPAVIVLGQSALATARRIQARYPGAQVHALQSRATADVAFTELGAHLRQLYTQGTPIVALCAAGIVIRCVAPLLSNKGIEPPVLAVAEDGSAVVPLLGGLSGVNVLAREIGETLGAPAAITTSGELRFGTCVLNPPEGYTLASLDDGKRFVSDLLAGAHTRIEGNAPWLRDAELPVDSEASHTIRITPHVHAGERTKALLIHPRSVVAAIADGATPTIDELLAALALHGLAAQSLAVLVASDARIGETSLEATADALGVPLRFVATGATTAAREPDGQAAALIGAGLAVPHRLHPCGPALVLAVADAPVAPASIGQGRGRLTVIGLGPGCDEWRVPAARTAIDEATDIVGYATYVEMAGPFRDDQVLHASDNREELQRARHAFELASAGRRVVVVSSGDPGVFAMAAAVLEALDGCGEPRWRSVELRIVPGVSAAMATAAQAGAPLGHDFCMVSLSDNLKPWSIIETRLRLAAQADLVMAFYNPVSRARPWQLDRAFDIVREHRAPETRVVLGRDIGRPGATLRTTTLGAVKAADVDMRTMVIVGSSTTRGIPGGPHGEWIYTPRWYRA